jgi:MoaA/NifB/PqqE/SkfB family radical SAM enzyme
MTYPIDAVIAVTYRCQARCRMCSIWQIKEHRDVPPDVYAGLPKSLNDVNISGGEPFLRKDLADIVANVYDRLPHARMVVSTNAFLGKALIPRALELKEIKSDIGFGISVDGVDEMHDFVRGIDGGFDKVVTVVKGLKAEGVRNLRIAYTLTTDNADHMIKVYELAKELGVQFTMQVSHDSEFFFGRHDSTIVKTRHPLFGSEKMRGDFESIINGELASFNVKRLVKAFGFYGMYKLAAEGEQLFPSQPGVDYFYLDPSGDVYPSVLHNYVMGNLSENDFDTLWRSERAEEARKMSAEDPMPYWLGCMLRKSLLDRKFQIGAWALKHKFSGVRL